MIFNAAKHIFRTIFRSPKFAGTIIDENCTRHNSEKSAACYLIEGSVFIRGYAITSSGLSRQDGDVVIAPHTEVEMIGQNLLNSLRNSGKVIRHLSPKEQNLSLRNDPLLKATKMKSWTDLDKLSKHVDVDLIKNQIVLTPYYVCKKRSRMVLSPLEKTVINYMNPSPTELGYELLKAFDMCDGSPNTAV